jgi:hypothetical protein
MRELKLSVRSASMYNDQDAFLELLETRLSIGMSIL